MSPQDHSSLPALTSEHGVEAYRQSTNAATLCKAIVLQTVQKIQGKRYVPCTGWQAIAVAHGCTASARAVEAIDGGVRAIGEVRRMDTGAVIAEAEGFVGDDEKMWASRPMYARRAMAQTRAISRACRSAFAHVLVMIDKDLGTTPAEEMEGVSQGWAGSNGDVDPADRGLTANAPKFTAGQLTRMKKWLEGATGTLALTGQTVGTLDAFWNEHAAKVEWLKENMPAEHKTLDAAYMAARDAAQAREPNTMQAG